MQYTAPKTWAYKESISSNDLNTYLRDNVIYLKESLPTATVIEYAGNDNPTHYLLCDGSAKSRTTYAELFAKIGTSFGAGDGSTTFNVPNKKGRVGIGADSSRSIFGSVGQVGGDENANIGHTHGYDHVHYDDHQHTGRTGPNSSSAARSKTDDLKDCAEHTHYHDFTTNGKTNGGYTSSLNSTYGRAVQTEGASISTVSVLQPFVVFNYFIKYE